MTARFTGTRADFCNWKNGKKCFNLYKHSSEERVMSGTVQAERCYYEDCTFETVLQLHLQGKVGIKSRAMQQYAKSLIIFVSVEGIASYRLGTIDKHNRLKGFL